MHIVSKIRHFVSRIVVHWFPKISYIWEDLSSKLYAKYGARLPPAQFLRYRYHEDLKRFEQAAWLEANGIFHSGSKPFQDPENLSAIITMEYHRLEKGLALPNRRIGAGQDVVVRLLQAIHEQFKIQGTTEEGAIGLRTLEIYLSETPDDAIKEETWQHLPLLEQIMDSYRATAALGTSGGYLEITAEEMRRCSGDAQVNFIRQRHSIRSYSEQTVEPALIREITEIALSTPSVCNRQAWRVYALDDKGMILKALAFQNGNRGFAEGIPLLFVVAADLRRFVSVEERNQGWIDGGLFSMTLMLAIHAKGLGSCPLNWSTTRENDRGLRNLLEIPEHEVIIMMISAGHLAQNFKVTASPRRNVDSILKIVSS
jgi:nitroreductase